MSENKKLSDIFEKARKECMEIWCKCIEKHYKIKPEISNSQKYNKLAYSYKPFEGNK